MGHKCYISFKTEDEPFKLAIQEDLDVDMIDKSLNEPIDSNDEDYILQKIRDDYLSDSSVTIHLIGEYGAEDRGWLEQQFIKRELQGSLYNSAGNSKSGILGVVLPNMYDRVFKGPAECLVCAGEHNIVAIGNSTTISEFSYNFYIPHNRCYHAEEDRYCVLSKWSAFKDSPDAFIDLAYEKRSSPIASKTKVRP